jgi:hypothetical protein
MPHFWNLSGIHPDVVMVLLLMLMYDRFLRPIRGRSSHPMILGSAIVPHFFALLEDTRVFPFFARSDRLRMLAYAGTSMHLVRAICGPTIYATRDINCRVMQMILGRVVSCTLGNPAIASTIALSFSAISSYPLEIPVADLCLSINPHLSPDCTIWEIFSLLSVLPVANAIRRISTEGFTPSQQEIYDKVYFVESIHGLIGNRVFIIVCKFFHKQKKSLPNPGRLSWFEPVRQFLPSRQFRAKFEELQRTPDFQEFMECIHSLAVTFLQPQDRKQPDFMLCWRVIEVFYESMTACNWNFMSRLLGEEDEDSVIELLEEGCPDSEVESPLSFSLSFPDNSANGSGLPFLSILRRGIYSLPSVRMPKELLKLLRKKKNRKFDEDAKSQFYRIMHILCHFINFLTSDSPHRDFISSCIVFLKSNQEATFRDLEIYLDLRKMDPSTVCDFCNIFSDFCNFANPSMHCTEMTKRSFLCFFDLMRDVLSHERFMEKFSILLHQLMRKKYVESIHDLIDTFINRRISTPGKYQFLCQMQPFQFTHCSECRAPLSRDNYNPRFRYDDRDNGLCDDCDARTIMEAQLDAYKEEERRIIARGPKKK